MQGRDVKILVLKHLADTELAFRAACELDEEVWNLFGALTSEWVDRRDWVGEYADPTDVLRLAPKKWAKQDNGKWSYRAQFLFDAGIGDDWERENGSVDAFWIQRLCGVGRGRVGFRWWFDYRAHGFGKADWRGFVKDHAERVSAATGMTFEDKEGTFYRPLKVELGALAKAYEEDAIEDALAPYTAALDAIERAVPALDVVFEAARAGAKRK